MRQAIIDTALKFDADVVGFAPASRFDKDDAIFKIFPAAKTVIGLGFRVLRGEYRGVEEGTTYYQYTTMGVENLEETVMPLALLRISCLIEENGFEAMPQRRNQLIMNEENETNPEVDYNDIKRGVKAENQIDFNKCAVLCGLGEKGLSGSILNDMIPASENIIESSQHTPMSRMNVVDSLLTDQSGYPVTCPMIALPISYSQWTP